MTYSAPSKRTVKVNSCGVLAIKGSARNPLTAASTMSIGDASPITFGNLPTGTEQRLMMIGGDGVVVLTGESVSIDRVGGYRG